MISQPPAIWCPDISSTTGSIAVHDSPRKTSLQKWYLIISEPYSLLASKILVSKCPTFKLHFLWNTSLILSSDFGYITDTLLYHDTIWTAVVRRESSHKYPQHTRVHSRLLLGEPARFVGHMAWILCIVESRIRIIYLLLLRMYWNIFQTGTPHIAAAQLRMTLWKGTHKELVEPFLCPLGLLW